MQYKDILTQASRRVGYKSWADIPKEDVLGALRFAEEDLMQETSVSKTERTIFIVENINSYNLPIDFGEPHEYVIYGEEGGQLAYEELTYEGWMSWNPGAIDKARDNELLADHAGVEGLETKARLSGRVVTAIRYDNKAARYKFFVKPAIKGRVHIYYSPALPDQDFDEELLDMESRLPKEFHRHIVAGVAMYLAQIEEGKAAAAGELEQAQYFGIIRRSARAEFREKEAIIKSKTVKETKSQTMHSYPWYDSPRKYR